MLTQDFLVVMRAILAATIRMMDASFGWCPEGYGHLQRPDRKITLHPITDGPTDHSTRMQIQDYSKI